MKKLLANKYYILSVSAATFILFIVLVFQGFAAYGDPYSSDNTDTSTETSSDSTAEAETDAERLERIMNSDIENDNTVITAVPFSTDTFGEHSFIVERSGSYKFTAVNLADSEIEVSWSIYVFDKAYQFGANYMMKNFEPATITDGTITLYKGQHVYCICSLNQYNYDNTDALAYLKIRLINEVDDSLHTEHVHDFKIKEESSSCGKNGFIIYECSCGETYIEATEPVEHDYEAVETKPTCTVDGFTTYTCKNCGDTYTESGDKATGHVCDNSKVQVTANTHEYTCTVCGEKVSVAHDFANTAFITGMTDNSGNIQYYMISVKKICSVCKYSAAVDSPDVAHRAASYNYNSNTGILTFTCEDCGSRSYQCSIELDYEIAQTQTPDASNSSSVSASSGGAGTSSTR